MCRGHLRGVWGPVHGFEARVVQTLCGALDSDKPFATKYASAMFGRLAPRGLHDTRNLD